MAGAALFLPAVSFIGTLLLAPRRVSRRRMCRRCSAMPLGKALGGRATELRPLNPFAIARMASCHLLAERYDGDDGMRSTTSA